MLECSSQTYRLWMLLILECCCDAMHRNYILPQDLVSFLPADKIDHAFETLDMDGDGRVSLQDIRDAVVQIYKVRDPKPLKAPACGPCEAMV